MQLFGRRDRALFHFDDLADPVFACFLVTRETQFVDVILSPLLDPDRNHERAVFDSFAAGFAHLGVDVAVVLVIFFDAIEVLLQLHFIEAA